jgi:hypothetical protein
LPEYLVEPKRSTQHGTLAGDDSSSGDAVLGHESRRQVAAPQILGEGLFYDSVDVIREGAIDLMHRKRCGC